MESRTLPVADDRLDAIRTLVCVVDLGSLSEAARRLGLTPSAVSKKLSRLEEGLGARLVERTTRRVRATDAGLELCERTRPLFEAFAEATAAVREKAASIHGSVRLSASPALGRARVVPALERVAREHPGLSFDVTLTGTRVDFFEDGIDLAVREGSLDDSTLVARRLGTASVLFCASQGYLDRRGRVRTVDDLEHRDLLLVPGAGSLRDLVDLRSRDGRRLRLEPRFRVNDLFALRDLAERGAGIVALPDYLAAAPLAEGRLVRVLPKVTVAEIPVHAVYPSRRHLPRRVAVVLDALAAAFAEA